MVYAYDLWAPLPTKDLYDSLIMLASINAAKDMYEKADAQLKEFNTKYGDFYSPIQKDMEWYKENVTDRSLNLINDLYNRGIDPLRSSLGRAELSRFINSVPVGTINLLKQSAAMANEYLKNKAQLEASGKYNKDLEERFLGNNLLGWSTVDNGMWTRTSPVEAKTLKEATESWYNNRTSGLLSAEEVADFGLNYDPRNKYYGFSRKSLNDIAAQQTPGWNDSVYSKYYRDIAKQKLIANGVKDPTADDIEQQLQKDIAQANVEYLIRPKVEADQWALEAQRAANQRALANSRRTKDDSAEGWTARRMVASYIQRQMQSGNVKSFGDWLKGFKANAKSTGKGMALTGNTSDAIHGYFNASKDTPKPGETLMALELFSNGLGTSKYTHEGDSSTKTTVSFMDDDLRPTNIAEVQWAGLKLNKNGVSSRWLQFLRDRSVSGEAKGKVTVNHTLTEKAGFPVHIMEMNRTVRLDKKWVKEFVNEYAKSKGKRSSDEFEEEVIKRLGLRGVGIKDDGYEFYDMPTSRRIELAGDDRPLVDSYSDALEFTKQTGAKRQMNYMNQSLKYDEDE